MSNRRKCRHPIVEVAQRLAGQRIPGGCEDCDAYQVMEPDPKHPMIVRITVHHDDTCPWLRKHQSRGA